VRARSGRQRSGILRDCSCIPGFHKEDMKASLGTRVIKVERIRGDKNDVPLEMAGKRTCIIVDLLITLETQESRSESREWIRV